MKKLLIIIAFLFCGISSIIAQQNFPVNGVKNEKKIIYAFTNANIFIDYKTRIKEATLIVCEDKILDVGNGITIPNNAVVYDMQGKYIYPSFIDIYSSYGIKAMEKSKSSEWPQYKSSESGAVGWNEALKTDYNAYQNFSINQKEAEQFRNAGFGVVLSLRKEGISRGSSTALALIDENPNKALIKSKAAACFSFNKGNSTQVYPSSLMGAIALIRQTYYDAQWYALAKNKEKNITLESWNELKNLSQIFESDDKLNTLRIGRIGDEFGVNYIIKTSGNEYQRMEEIKKTKARYILPLNFPEAYDLSDPYDAANVSLASLKHWELAPYNPYFFEKSGIDFALTTDGLKEKKDIFKQLNKAILTGLTEQQVLKALTYTPAEFLALNQLIGSLRKNYLANFIISSGNIFEKNNIIYENWVLGERYIINDIYEPSIQGKYSFILNDQSFKLTILGNLDNKAFELRKDTTKCTAKGNFKRNRLTLSFEVKNKTINEFYRVSAEYNNKDFIGKVQMPDGNWQNINIKYLEANKDTASKNNHLKNENNEIKVIYPFCAYGTENLPIEEEVILKNASVWTNEKEGILQQTDVWIKNGKIFKVGKNLLSTSAKIIDASNKHITSGIIDEHSHIAVSHRVNESGLSNSSEVRIADVIDCDDINIYRQLAGGVTTSHILHGSANAIGGQSQLIKLRWGKSPEQMKFEGADPFIKFALGENVKQTNWGEKYTIRYPQTRMGVEQIYTDAFTRALEYENQLKNTKENPVRKDLQLDAMLEIIRGKRFITCHSYQQSEINMLMHVADSFHFKVNTFTHILEGYKVADKLKKHGSGASTFADWWAYKYEVIEAIPYNGAILNKMNVTTAFNSDDPEMARRLNQEAAKAIKYGNVSEEEALKFVTLNPAKLLHIDSRTGSIKEGKDADIVLWDNHPLSIYAKVIQTYVDGICYYDSERNKRLQDEIQKERNRLIQKMMNQKDANENTQKPLLKNKKLQHCNDHELINHQNDNHDF
ncbi:MAG: amidohydrolase family protein [Bacteroidia bacterium]|nr:amidohydrolase family protein [Bacteroidia bacterium]MCZ2249057.1 amidohydrolase family protein [Bacteroidia bacterium]